MPKYFANTQCPSSWRRTDAKSSIAAAKPATMPAGDAYGPGAAVGSNCCESENIATASTTNQLACTRIGIPRTRPIGRENGEYGATRVIQCSNPGSFLDLPETRCYSSS